MQAKTDPRHNSRVIALQRLFEKEFSSRNSFLEDSDNYTWENLKEIDDISGYDKDLVDLFLKELPLNVKKLDELIVRLAPEWPIEKISLMDLLILRLALLEGFVLKITPQKVVINEAIELSKEFSNEQTRRFVSGVLGNIYENQEKYLNDK